MHAIVTVPSCYKDFLSSQHAKEKADNRHMLYKILSADHFLARPGLPCVVVAMEMIVTSFNC